MLSCVIYGCSNNTLTNNNPEITYYYFPKQPEIVQQWIDASGWDKEHIDIENARVCSVHFEEQSYTTEYKVIDFIPCYTKVLKYNAVPSLYLPITTQIVVNSSLDVNHVSDDQNDIKQIIVFVPAPQQTCEVSSCEERSYIDLQHSAAEHYKTEAQQEAISNEKYSFVTSNEQLVELKIANNHLKEEISHIEVATNKLESEIIKKQNEWKEKLERYRNLKQQFRQLRQKLQIIKHQKSILPKIFSTSQIKILSGKKKIYWSNDDMAVGYTIRHLSNKRCYSYLTKNLKIPLPAVSSIKRWTNLKYKTTAKRSLKTNTKVESD